MIAVKSTEATSALPAPDRKRWGILAVLCLALLMIGIDGTIVNVALPTLVHDVHASASQLQWIVDAYTIIFASFLLIAGNTGDRLGRKGCLAIGLTVFTLGSFGCSQAHSVSTLILLRGLQGFGAAFVMPATLSIITNVFTDDSERARAIALWAGVSGLGVAIGPLVGGYLLEHFWWGSIFLVNVPIGIVVIPIAFALIPESRDPHASSLDVVGTVLSTVGLVALLYGVIEGPTSGWGHSTIIGSFVAAVVLLSAFVLWERHTDHPILDVTFFANPRFTAASIAVTLVFFAMFGSMFFISQYLQFVLKYSTLASGARLIPIAVVLMIAAPASAKLVARYGTKRIVTLGLVLVAAALALFSRATTTSGYGLIAAVLVIIGIGMGLAMAPATDSIMGSLPPDKAGVGSAMNDTTREIGGALGVAILGSITTATYTASVSHNSQFATLKAASPAAAAAVKDSIGAAAVVVGQVPASTARVVAAVANHAFVKGLDHAVLIGAVVALVGAAIADLYLPARAHEGEAMEQLIDGAALRVGPRERRKLAHITFELLAEAGMSSLTYNAVAARSGVGTQTLRRFWSSRVDAITDALTEVMHDHPVPATGDLTADLHTYLRELRDGLDDPMNRQAMGAIVAEAATDPDMSSALRERIVGPRRAELTARLSAEAGRLRVPIDAAVDQLVGPVFHRVLFTGESADDGLLDSILATLVIPSRPRKAAIAAKTAPPRKPPTPRKAAAPRKGAT